MVIASGESDPATFAAYVPRVVGGDASSWEELVVRRRTTRPCGARTGTLLASLEGHRDDISSARSRPDGTQLVTASARHPRALSNSVFVPDHLRGNR